MDNLPQIPDELAAKRYELVELLAVVRQRKVDAPLWRWTRKVMAQHPLGNDPCYEWLGKRALVWAVQRFICDPANDGITRKVSQCAPY